MDMRPEDCSNDIVFRLCKDCVASNYRSYEEAVYCMYINRPQVSYPSHYLSEVSLGIVTGGTNRVC